MVEYSEKQLSHIHPHQYCHNYYYAKSGSLAVHLNEFITWLLKEKLYIVSFQQGLDLFISLFLDLISRKLKM